MRHIRQINSVGTNSYTVVIAEEPLENHRSVVNYPDLFEISEDELPEYIQYVDVQPPTVPFEVQLWRIRTVLKLMQLEAQIESAIDAMPEPSKTAATYIWKFGTTVERSSQTVLLLQSVLQLTDEQVDDLFIQADAILL
jgi:hypothetical protein